MQEDLNTGKQEIIYNPGRERLCRNCPKQNICQEEIEISMPIRLKSETIGVIGLVGRDPKTLQLQEEILMAKEIIFTPKAPRLWGRLAAWWRLSVWLRNKPVRGSYEHSRK